MKLGILRAAPALAAFGACTIISTTAFAADAPIQGNIDAAREKISMCMGCHGIQGYRASYPEVYRVPKIGGQSAAYIESALRQYATGARSHPTMDAISRSLSDQDIADLAAYYASFK
ncbi:MAG: cytochrome c [Pigmentiphaga sp.]|nr:cytochrome c [Pigmentiphaga sp.]